MGDESCRRKRGRCSKMGTEMKPIMDRRQSWPLTSSLLLTAVLVHLSANPTYCSQSPLFSNIKKVQATAAHDDFGADEVFAFNLSEASPLQLPDYVIDDDDQMILYPANNFETSDGLASSLKVRRQIGDEWPGLAEQRDFIADQDTYPPSGPFQHSTYAAQQQYGATNFPLDSQQDILFNVANQQQQARSASGLQDDSAPLLGPNQKVGPSFTREPPSFIHYLNSSDLVIGCAASGQPAPSITWWHKQGGQVKPGSLLDKRYVRYDNALVISAFRAHEFEPDLHSTSYRCQAQNALGTIISRDVVINAVLDQQYEASVADQFVAVDNDALFRCQVAPQLRDLFQVIGWLEDGQQLIGATGSQAGQSQAQTLANLFAVSPHAAGPSLGATTGSWMQSSPTKRRSQMARASMLPNGQLVLARVQLRDANKSYRCQIRNLLSGRITVSAISGRLFVTDANESGAAARIVEGPKPATVGKPQEQLLLTCLAQGSPRPTIRWFKWSAGELASAAKEAGQWIELLQPAAANYSQNQVIKSQNESLQQQQARFLLSSENNFLLIKSLQPSDRRARFKCLANNSFGAHQLETEIQLERWPTSKLLELKPRVEFISAGGVAQVEQAGGSGPTRQSSSKQLVLNCTVRGSPTQPIRAIEWLKNGRQLFAVSLAAGPSDSPSSFNGSLGKMGAELASATQSLFGDPNQELTVIEQLWPQTSESSGRQDQLEGADHELSRGSLLDIFDQTSGRPEQQQQQQQQQEQQMLFEQTPLVSSSTTLAKLVEAVERHEDSANGRRFSQSLRAIDDEQLLYQLTIWQPQRRAERGSYQCRATTSETILQQTSQLLLRDTAPKFVNTFASQLVGGQAPERAAAGAANAGVSLKCVASGSPLPEISWTLSGFQVPESSRFRVGDYVTRDGLIVSFVNISQVQVEDGGLYECTASNDVGQLRHAAWLNVTGPPHVRPMSNVSAIAGGSLGIMCPVGGWPIEQISWFKNGTKLPANHRQKVFANGTLQVAELNELLDAGQYSCQAKWARPAAASDLFASSRVHVTIKIPPVVEPFSFAKSLHRGQRYNIMCTVTRGDLPVSIRWFKDGQQIGGGGAPLPAASNQLAGGERISQQTLEQADWQQQSQLTQQLRAEHQFGLAIKQLDPYSSTLTFPSLQSHHRGLYSCEAHNEVGRANQSSTLAIQVPPEWRIEPNDLSVTIGHTAVIDCQADGFPAARVEWRLSQDLFREPPTEFKPIVSSLYMRVFENGSLIIYNTQRSDAGYYLCQASNGVGPGISRVIKLTVHVAAHFKSKIRTELVRRGQGARLRCEALGDPPLEINWLKDKAPLYYAPLDEPRYSLTRTPLQDGLRSELVIQETERQDSALFTCLAQNQFGSDDTNIQLLVQAPPDLLQDVTVQEYEARSVKLSWRAGYAGNSPISKFVLMFAPVHLVRTADEQQSPNELQPSGSRQVGPVFTNVSLPGNESAHLLQGLTPLTEYQFYLVAVNSLGSSPLQPEPIRFRTDDEAPSSPPLKVRAQPISAHSIRVRWRAPERRQQQHYGAISGFYVGYKLLRANSPAAGAISSQPSSELNTALARHQSSSTTSSSASKALDTYIYKTVEFNHNAQLINELLPSSNRSGQQVGYLEQECQINSLRRGQRYLITVHPFNARGSGPASEPVVAETWRIDVPDAPSLRMVARTTHSIHLAWRLPKLSPMVGGQGKKLRMLDEAEDESRSSEDNEIARRKQRSGQSFAARYLAQTSPNENQPSDEAAQLAAEELAAEESQANEPILGFILSRKQLSHNLVSSDSKQVSDLTGDVSQAVETRLPSEHTAQIVDALSCGTRYQFTVAAINSVGVSAPSEPLIVKTEGSTPVAPDRNSLLSLNSSAVVINLAAWHNGACAMRSFDILFKQSRSKKWSTVTNYQVAPHQSGADRASKGARDNQSRSLVTNEAGGEAVQRTAGASGSSSHSNEWQQLQENGTVVLNDLATSINYDLKILATNEAGTTEALYSFITNGQSISSLDQPWSTGGDFPLGEGQLSDLFASAGTLASLLPLLLLLLLVGLSLTTGCILFSRRKRHSSSNCSLSISSRSNQSSSNYCTTTTTGAGSSAAGAISSEPAGLMKNSHSTFLQSTSHKYGQLEQSEQQKLMDEDGAGTRTLASFAGKHQTIRLGDIYGHSGSNQLATGNNYAYLTSTMRQRHLTDAAQSADVTSVLNGSEAEMCLGASALNLSNQQAISANRAQQHHSLTLNNKRTFNSHQSADHYLTAAAMNNHHQAGSNTLLMTEQHTADSKLVSQLAQLGKSSTLPSNCHQQILQKLLFQQQDQQQHQQHQQLDSDQQALLDSFVAANMMQQHQSHPGAEHENQQAIAYASLQAAMQQQQQQFSSPINEQEAQASLANLLDQQVRQQLYATVKRGCPRAPNQQVYTTIYQCPATSEQQQVGGRIGEPHQQQQQMACCSGQLQGPNACADSQGQMFCFHQPVQQQASELQAQDCNQQQQQIMSDYQQLRPLN